MAGRVVPHIMSLADLTAPQIQKVVNHSFYLKHVASPWLLPLSPERGKKLRMPSQSLFSKSIALLFSKRSTRTRLSAETAAVLLGGRAIFLGKEDIQLGVNESLRDSARVIGGMCQGIFARVDAHEEIEELAKYSPVPVLNALSSLWHPTQILADLLTLHENAHRLGVSETEPAQKKRSKTPSKWPVLPTLPEGGLTIAYVGDPNNVLHDMLVSLPRLGHKVRIASPPGYRSPNVVLDRVQELGCDKDIWRGEDPREAVHGADVVVTDTCYSMGQEAEKAQRLKDFQGYQVTEELCQQGGAKPNWVFLHCLPRKGDEVDDEVFYGPRSLVFEASDNRKWTIMALFDLLFGKWDLAAASDKAE